MIPGCLARTSVPRVVRWHKGTGLGTGCRCWYFPRYHETNLVFCPLRAFYGDGKEGLLESVESPQRLSVPRP